MKKLLRFLAVMGTLCSFTPKASGAESQENTKAKSDISLYANAEQVGNDSTFGEITIAPHVAFEKGDYKVDYLGMAYNYGYTDHTYGDWLALMSRLQLQNPDWTFQVGRMMQKTDYAACAGIPFPTTLGNDVKVAGSSRIFTGTHLRHEKTGLGVGLIASDTRMTPTHWDTGLFTWEKKLGDEWAVATHVGAGDKGIRNAALTVAYTPTDKTSVIAEGLYNAKTAHGIFGVRHKLTDSLSLFAGTKVSKPEHGKLFGWLTAGANYDLGKGFSAVIGVRQDIGGEHNPHGIIGIKYAGSFGIAGQ